MNSNGKLKILSTLKEKEGILISVKWSEQKRDIGGHGDVAGRRIGINLLQCVDFLFQELAVAQGNGRHYCRTAQRGHKV